MAHVQGACDIGRGQLNAIGGSARLLAGMKAAHRAPLGIELCLNPLRVKGFIKRRVLSGGFNRHASVPCSAKSK